MPFLLIKFFILLFMQEDSLLWHTVVSLAIKLLIMSLTVSFSTLIIPSHVLFEKALKESDMFQIR